jgi:hypothetical protein
VGKGSHAEVKTARRPGFGLHGRRRRLRSATMSDRMFFPLMALAMLALIAFSLVWPQGDGRRSPGPFGHVTTADAQARAPKLRPAISKPAQKPGIL